MKLLNTRFLLAMSMLMSVMTTQALQVENEAGGLADRIDDTTITVLTVTGTVNAVDFRFIRENLTSLQKLNMTGATIVASEETRDDNTVQYAANAVPDYALFGMKLNEVVLPESVTAIGEAALAGNGNLTAITLPASLTALGDNALNATGLTAVIIPANLETLGKGVFSNCTALTEATYFPADEQALSEETFMGCTSLASLNLGSNITALGKKSLAGCTALTALELPADTRLEEIRESALESSGLTSVDLTRCDALTTIGMYAFANTPATTIALPQSLAEVGEGAFFYNTALGEISFPESITTFSDFLLAGCNSYQSNDVIGENVTNIGDYTFYNWDQMASFIIPANVEYLGTRAMAGMTGLTEVKAKPMTVPALGENVWEGVDQPSVPLKVAKGIIDDYKVAAQWQEFRIERDVPTAIDDVVATAADVKAYFAGTELIVTANADIASVSVYSVGGVLLNRVTPMAPEARLETMNYQGKVYIVNVTLADGSNATFKLLR